MADVSKLLKSVRKDIGSESFLTSKLGVIDHYIDTGCMAINRIISGSIYGGIPNGRVILMGGESSTGKSILAAQAAANALNKNNYDHIFYFDSEGGGMKDFFEGRGADVSKIEHIPLMSVEDATVKILGVFRQIMDFKKETPDAEFLCILDSLGALVPEKLIKDAADGKQVQDMGLRAKLINNLMKGSLMPALVSGSSLIVTNHVYDDPASFFPSMIKNQGGGHGKDYVCHIGLQLSRKLEKAESKDDTEAIYKGSWLNFFTTKNRIVKPFYKAGMYIDFSQGIKKYDGLFEPAVEYGFIENPKQGYYQVPAFGDKMFRRSQLLDGKEADEVWGLILDDFDKASVKDMQYSRAEMEILEAGGEVEVEIPKELVEEILADDMAATEAEVKKETKK